MLPDLSNARWRKASASGNQGTDCVELAHVGAVRDSKNPDGPVLLAEVARLVSAVKTGAVGR